MKKNSLLKYLLLFGILIFMSNCTTDSDLEILEETNEIENFQSKSNNPVNCNKDIYITFNYPPGANSSARQAHRDAYYGVMSQYFTICERYYGCSYEKWKVNNQEYLNYLSGIPLNETDDDGDTSGGSSSTMKPGCLSWVLVSEQGPVPTGNEDDTPGDEFLGW